MLDLFILLIVGVGFIKGLKRGFIRQLLHLTGFIIAGFAAYSYQNELAPALTLVIPYPNVNSNEPLSYLIDNANLEDAYYRAIAFVVIFFAVKILLRIVTNMLDFITRLPVIKLINVWAGGLLGFIESYLIMFFLLFIAAFIPNESIQTLLSNSFVAELIVKHTPFLSEQIQNLWMIDNIKN